MSSYPNNKCGSCDGCWFKTNQLMPDNDSVKNGQCPAYHAIEFKEGLKVTFRHWSDNNTYTGTIKEIGSFNLFIESPTDTWAPSISNMHEYMNYAYNDCI